MIFKIDFLKYRNLIVILVCSFISILFSESIDIVSNFSVSDLPVVWNKEGEEEINFRFFNSDLSKYISKCYSNTIDKVIVFNDVKGVKDISRIPYHKRILFLWEPLPVSSSYCNFFSQVYTFKDQLVNNKLYRKFYYPFLNTDVKKNLNFEQKKLCSIVTRNWTKERKQITTFFILNEPAFEFWGWNRGPFKKTKKYKGMIPGTHSGNSKVEVMSKYKFSICFENCRIPGYISEKIFSCFAAGTIPIYLGAPNIKEYIPKDCFIDYLSFESNEELLDFLKNMSEEEYNRYLDNISAFLQTEKAYLFSPDYFRSLIVNME